MWRPPPVWKGGAGESQDVPNLAITFVENFHRQEGKK
jgi:hypothetical protein